MRLQVHGAIGTEGNAPSEFGIPHNVATDAEGNVYVTEANPQSGPDMLRNLLCRGKPDAGL